MTDIGRIAKFIGDKFVLVIEPSINYRTSLKQFLVNLKIKNVRIVSNVAEARTEMLSYQFGLFICEWKLSDFNGLQFCRELRSFEQHRHVPFLLTSVENLRRDVILATEVGVDGYLLKPFSYEEFRDQVLAVCRARQTNDKLTMMLAAGDKFLNEGNLPAAEDLFHNVLIEFPDSARALAGLGQIATMQGDKETAAKHLLESIKINPFFIEGHRALLNLYESENNVHGIIHVALKLNDLSPDNPKYTLVLAKNYLEISDLDKSEDFFRRTIRLSPMIAEAYKGLGSVFMLRDDLEQAMQNFHKALDLDGQDVGTLNSLALLYIRLGKVEEGINKYKLILKIDPNDARVHFNLGFAYERKDLFDLAEQCYNEALIRDPNFLKAKRGLQRLNGPRKAS